MPRSGEQTRRRILDAAYTLFRRRGFTRVSMDDIAAQTAVTKRTLYHHFTSKDALLGAVLESQQELALAAFRTFGDRMAGSPEQMVATMFEQLAVWSDQPRWAGSGFTRLVVELADLPGHPARVVARRHKAVLERQLAELLARAGIAEPAEAAREIWLLSEGAISSMLVHSDRRYAAAAGRAALTLLRARGRVSRSGRRAAARPPGASAR
jgi:AcrR family transcriptional regulator